MRVSTHIPYHDWSLCGPAAAAAEAVGFDAIQCPELKHDPFIPLAFAALATSRVELATSVAISFPRSPMVWRIWHGTCTGIRKEGSWLGWAPR